MGKYHSNQPIQPEFEPNLGDLDPSKTETLNTDSITELGDNKTEESSEIIEVSVFKDRDLPLNQDWFSLARKLRGQNRQLLDTIVTLEESLSNSKQELQNYQERSRQHNALLCQQTAQLQSIKAENGRLSEQLQQQKTHSDSLQNELQGLRESFACLEREYALIKEETLKNKHQFLLKEEEIQKLQQRLLRQQRYNLKYKSALDQFLNGQGGTTDGTQPKESVKVDDATSADIVSIQPWSDSLDEKVSPGVNASSLELDSSNDSLQTNDQTLEQLFSLNPGATAKPKSNPSVTEMEHSVKEVTSTGKNDTRDTSEDTAIAAQDLLFNRSAPFSFSIAPHRKEDAAREKVDLPSFLRRQ
ncbi:hypothetical protein [Crocosphaera sp. Alani8]|uniref:hypothetical protein n=1 Tax=Crocosphaera sp. Alani8 TaxID=3038952 RepID=UPI00313B7B56